RRGRKELCGIRADRGSGGEAEDRTDPLAPREQRVAHRLLEPASCVRRAKAQVRQVHLDELPQLVRVLAQGLSPGASLSARSSSALALARTSAASRASASASVSETSAARSRSAISRSLSLALSSSLTWSPTPGRPPRGCR